MDERVLLRKKLYKAGIDINTGLNKRVNAALSLRKEKNRENLSKKRGMPSTNINDRQPNDKQSHTKQLIDEGETNQLLAEIMKIYSNDPDIALDGLIYVRSVSHRMISDILMSKVYYKIIEMLSYEHYTKHQLNAAWIMTNILSSDYTDANKHIIEETALPEYILELCKHDDDELKTQAIWCLGNISGESSKYSEIIINKGGLDLALLALESELYKSKYKPEHLNTISWVIYNILSMYKRPIGNSLSKSIIKIFRIALDRYTGKEFYINITKSFCEITKHFGKHEYALMLSENGGPVDQHFLTYIDKLPHVRKYLMRTIGDLISGPDIISIKLINMGIMDYLDKYKSEPLHKKEVYWIISNMAACNNFDVKNMVCQRFLYDIFNCLTTESYFIKKESMYALVNLLYDGYPSIMNTVLSKTYCKTTAIELMCVFLGVHQHDPDLIIQILTALDNILTDPDINKYYATKIEEYGYFNIEKLETHKDKAISDLSDKIINSMFNHDKYNVYSFINN